MIKNILIEQARHPLHKVIHELNWGRPAEIQKFVVALANELKHKKPRPVCPRCCEPLVRARIAADGGVIQAWLCECETVQPCSECGRPVSVPNNNTSCFINCLDCEARYRDG